MQPLWGNQCLGHLGVLTVRTDSNRTSLMSVSLVLATCVFRCPTYAFFLKLRQNPHIVLTFWEGAESLAAATPKPSVLNMCFTPLSTSQLPKTLWTCQLLTSKCASGQDTHYVTMHFSRFQFNISTSKSAPTLLWPWSLSFELLCSLTSNFARHLNNVQVFISYVPSWICTCRFSKPL